MTVPESLVQQLLTAPDPDVLWRLQPYLLESSAPGADQARALAGSFYRYLCLVRSKLTARQYSVLSATLAAGAVGVMAARDVLDTLRQRPEEVIAHLLAGGLAQSLEAFSTVQHVKAWGAEYLSAHDEAAWDLYAALWQISATLRPDLPLAERDALVQQVLAPLRDPDTDSALRTALIVRLYQTLLLVTLMPLLEAGATPARDGAGS